MQEPLPNFKVENSKLAFGASRGFQDSIAIRQTGELLEDIFTTKLGNPDAGAEYKQSIDKFLMAGDKPQAAQIAQQGVEYLKNNYQIGIG